MRRFVGEPLAPVGDGYATAAGGNEPPLPSAFRWRDRELTVKAVLRVWRSSKTDRGDTYLKRHWFEVETGQGERAELYYDRAARRAAPRWWLFALDDL